MEGNPGLSPSDFPGRRAVPRRSSLLTACLCDQISGESVPVRVRDISVKGIGLEAPRPYDRGQFLTVRLDNPARDVARTRTLIVVHCAGQTPGPVLVGCAFARRLRDDELEAMS